MDSAASILASTFLLGTIITKYFIYIQISENPGDKFSLRLEKN